MHQRIQRPIRHSPTSMPTNSGCPGSFATIGRSPSATARYYRVLLLRVYALDVRWVYPRVR